MTMTGTLTPDARVVVDAVRPVDAVEAVDILEPIDRRRLALIVGVTLFFAIAAYYFIGVDEGMCSVFGKTLVIHEWVHDSRHFLGFPCH